MLCCSSSFVPKIMGGNYIIDTTLKSEVKQKIVLNLIICKPVKNYNGQKFREMRISRYVMRNLISRNIQCEFRITENKGFFEVLRAFIGPSELLIIEKKFKNTLI